MDNYTKGRIAELRVMAALMRQGYEVYEPCAINARYDVGFVEGGTASRVQVKWANYKYGAIVWPTCSYRVKSYQKTKKSYFSYRGDVDYFGVYSDHMDKCYLIPIMDVGERRGVLRVEHSNKSRIKLKAVDYEL